MFNPVELGTGLSLKCSRPNESIATRNEQIFSAQTSEARDQEPLVNQATNKYQCAERHLLSDVCCRFEHLQATAIAKVNRKANQRSILCVRECAARETVARTQTHVANKMILSPLDDVALNREQESYVLHS